MKYIFFKEEYPKFNVDSKKCWHKFFAECSCKGASFFNIFFWHFALSFGFFSWCFVSRLRFLLLFCPSVCLTLSRSVILYMPHKFCFITEITDMGHSDQPPPLPLQAPRLAVDTLLSCRLTFISTLGYHNATPSWLCATFTPLTNQFAKWMPHMAAVQ